MASQTLQFLAAPVSYLTRAQREYGDVFTARLLREDWTVIADQVAIRQVFSAPPQQLRAGEASRVLQPLIGTRNTLMLDGEEYIARRRLLLPAFHGAMLREREQEVRQAVRKEFSNWSPGVPFAVLPRFQALAASIVQRSVLGQAGGPLASAVLDLLAWLTSTSRLAYYFTFGANRLMRRPGYQSRQRRIDALMRMEIRRRREAGGLDQRTDVLSMLLAARDEHGSPLPEKDIRDETVTLLVAGHENTAALLAWACHELARNQHAQRLLAHDPDTWIGRVITETLRLRPPVPIVPRRLTEPLSIAGYDLPAGSNVAPCVLLAQRDPRVYENPLRFDPERFAEKAPPAWFPFGGGVRRCIGDAFAQMESRIILRELIGAYRIETVGPAERTRPRALVLVPSGGGNVVLATREPGD